MGRDIRSVRPTLDYDEKQWCNGVGTLTGARGTFIAILPRAFGAPWVGTRFTPWFTDACGDKGREHCCQYSAYTKSNVTDSTYAFDTSFLLFGLRVLISEALLNLSCVSQSCHRGTEQLRTGTTTSGGMRRRKYCIEAWASYKSIFYTPGWLF